MQNKTLYRDMIPYRAGIVRITPLDSSFSPLYDQAYTTGRDFLTSTQRSTSYSYETFYNSNGDASDYITQRRENITLTTQIYDPRFDALISGKESVEASTPTLKDIEITLSSNSFSYIFNEEQLFPCKSSDGEYHFEIRDYFGVSYKRVISNPSDYEFTYDNITKKLEFSKSEFARNLTCVYYTTDKSKELYQDSPTVKNNVFMIEAFGEMQSASSGIKQACYTCIKRVTLSGELTGVSRQKSINNAISYTFSSAPFKRNESPCVEIFENL